MLSYKVILEDDIVIISLSGDFIVGNIENFYEKLMDKILKYKKVIFDFSDVKFIDSSGVGLLITFLKELNKRKISIKLCSLNKDLKNIFKKLNVFSFFEIYENCEEAIAYF